MQALEMKALAAGGNQHGGRLVVVTVHQLACTERHFARHPDDAPQQFAAAVAALLAEPC
ncbi:hypothetical protein [Streptomyces flavofungini]|uniref:hypothetical protein n=1 Tax=Streptomyces flavofungini TaxID=68200 RepID=UPI0025B230EA|nr:hypothetical protein [Streptomyces flavofungini]WJV46661.1 hypothetical protein QUY26_14700 [Streptomyces flavofungini]